MIKGYVMKPCLNDCRRGFAIAGLLVALTTFVGCEKNDGLCLVEGTVTLDGSPVADGMISFGPTIGSSGTATGAKIVDGKYSARASAGEMSVAIRAQKKRDRARSRSWRNDFFDRTYTRKV